MGQSKATFKENQGKTIVPVFNKKKIRKPRKLPKYRKSLVKLKPERKLPVSAQITSRRRNLGQAMTRLSLNA